MKDLMERTPPPPLAAHLGATDIGPNHEETLNQVTIFKSLNVTRIFDRKTQVLIYLTHAKGLSQGRAGMSVSTRPLHGAVKD